MTFRRRILPGFLIFALFSAFSPSACAEGIPLILQGVSRTLFSAFQIPGDMIKAMGRSFPFGIVGGAVSGTVKAVNGTAMGAVDMVRGAAPYAKYAALALV